MILSENQKALLNSIQGKLNWGDKTEIARKTGLSRVYVSQVLEPTTDTFNMKVVETAAAIISKRDQNTKKLLQQVTSAA